MSTTHTESVTYTVVDVGRVLDCFAADLDGMSQSTGLSSRDATTIIAADVKLMAEWGYVSEINVYLEDATGATIRAAKYEVSTEGICLAASRPGNNLWPRTPGGKLFVHVTKNLSWKDLPASKREAFRQLLGYAWGASALDTSFPMLTRRTDRDYASGGFGLRKSSFS